MADLLRPVKLDKDLEERIGIDNKEFIVGMHNAHFYGRYIMGYVYAAQVKKDKTFWGKPKDKIVNLFDVAVLVAVHDKFEDFITGLNKELREKYCKILNEGFELKPFYGTLRKIHEHYVQQNEDSQRIQIEIPAQIAAKCK